MSYEREREGEVRGEPVCSERKWEKKDQDRETDKTKK